MLNEEIHFLPGCGVGDLACGEEGFDDVFWRGEDIGDDILALDEGLVDVAVDLRVALRVDDFLAGGLLVVDRVGGQSEQADEVDCEQEEEAMGEFAGGEYFGWGQWFHSFAMILFTGRPGWWPFRIPRG